VLLKNTNKGKGSLRRILYMPRISGVDIPLNKRIEIGLTYIYGIGRKTSIDILSSAAIDLNKRSKDLDDKEVAKLREIVENQYTVEGDLKKEIQGNIRRLVEIGCYSVIFQLFNDLLFLSNCCTSGALSCSCIRFRALSPYRQP